MTGQVSLYNPRTTPPEQLEAMLVGRDALLKEVFDNLREQARGKTRQHWLLRGPRGMGKTHLTGIIHHRVRNDPQLSKAYLPLWLGEADVYEVYSPATLLERIAERLIEEVPDAGLGTALHSLEGVGDEEGLFQELSRLLSEEAERQKKTLLVLMENLDALLEGFAPKEREAQTRQLRSLLLHDSHFLFISTTPTRYLADLTNPKKPLYNQFKERSLKPLSVEEVGSIFSKLAALTGRLGMEQAVGSGQDAALRRKVIHQLTGGLPRSVVMAFGVMQDRSGIKALVEDLRKLLDAQTAYFEARLARLAPRERAIVTAMALASENLTLKEVASRSRLPEKPLSTLMSRLVQDGHVEVTAGTGGKGTVYGLSEGLFRLWYQYRKGRLLLEPLVRLLAYLFNPSELQDTITSLRQDVADDALGSRDSARLALRQAEEALRLATSEEGQRDRERLWKECLEDAQAAAASTEYLRITELIDRSFSKPVGKRATGVGKYTGLIEQVLDAAEGFPEPLARTCIDHLHGRLFLFVEESAQASAQALELLLHQVQAHTGPAFRWAESFVRISLSLSLEQLGRYEESLQQVDEALRHSDHHQPEKYWPPLGFGLWHRAHVLEKLGRIPEAVHSYKQFIRQIKDGTLNIPNAGMHAAFNLAKLFARTSEWREEEHALKSMLQLANISALDEKERDLCGIVRLRLILLGMEHRTLSLSELHSSLEQWLSDFPNHDLSKSARTLRDSARDILGTMNEEDPKAAAAAFLANPAAFYLYLEPQQVRQFLDRLGQGLLPDQVAPLRPHFLVIEAMELAPQEGPGARARLKQILGRLPPELRQMVQELTESMSVKAHETPKSKKASGNGQRRK